MTHNDNNQHAEYAREKMIESYTAPTAEKQNRRCVSQAAEAKARGVELQKEEQIGS